MMFPGNGWPVEGSVIRFEPKFPVRWLSVGTMRMMDALLEFAFNCRELSQPPKKKVRSRNTRPAALPPNWFWLFFPRTGLKNGRAFNSVLRRNSYTPPCRVFDPERVVTLITEPRLRPYSAL